MAFKSGFEKVADFFSQTAQLAAKAAKPAASKPGAAMKSFKALAGSSPDVKRGPALKTPASSHDTFMKQTKSLASKAPAAKPAAAAPAAAASHAAPVVEKPAPGKLGLRHVVGAGVGGALAGRMLSGNNQQQR